MDPEGQRMNAKVAGRLDGKIALITGAASGIGWATAELFASEGAVVILADRAADKLAQRRDELSTRDTRHRAFVMDVTSEAEWVRVTQEIERELGRLDVLVNNAGVGYFRSIVATTFEEWRNILAVNLDSVFLGTKHALPLLTRSGKGSIVNVSSIRGQVAGPNVAAYSASKAGVRLFTKSTALECAAAGNGIRANSVHPGVIETPMSAQALEDPAKLAQSVERIPVGRLGKAAEIAAAIVFLASDESSYMTGSEVTIDGGYTAQ
jgi:meso-butanediol dehydrogenase / (S,S)-butanediol dehydrogenase / diacetyl reductase